MMKWLLLPALPIMLCAQPAIAAQWVLVSKPFSTQKVSVDRDSITQRGTVMTFLAKVTDPVLAPVSPDSTVDPQGVPINAPPAALNSDGTAYQMQMSCTARTVRISSSSIGNGQVNPFGSTNTSPYTFQPLGGEVAFSLYGALCWANPKLGLAPAPFQVPEQDPTPRRTINPVQNPWPIKNF